MGEFSLIKMQSNTLDLLVAFGDLGPLGTSQVQLTKL